MSILLIFKMQEINDALFLKAFFLSYALLSGFVTVIVPFTTTYANIDLILALMFYILFVYSVCIYLQHYPTDHELLSIFLVINLGTSSGVVPNTFVIFCYSIFIWYENNLKLSIIYCRFSGGI